MLRQQEPPRTLVENLFALLITLSIMASDVALQVSEPCLMKAIRTVLFSSAPEVVDGAGVETDVETAPEIFSWPALSNWSNFVF